MNPYNRFIVVSNAISAAIVLMLVATAAPAVMASYEAVELQGQYAPYIAGGAALAVTIIVWLSLVAAVLPFFFRYTPIRRLILGKHYMEGTWIQAEKQEGLPRMAVIEIQPAGNSFRFSGYAVDENLDVQSNVAMEFSRFDWPFMTYKFRNTFAESVDEGREGVGEIHFETNRHAPRTFNGFVQSVNRKGRVKTEGVRLTHSREVRNLRSVERRAEVIDKYWGLFFERGSRAERLRHKKTAMFGQGHDLSSGVSSKATKYETEDAGQPIAEQVENNKRDESSVERRSVAPLPPSDKVETDGVVLRRRSSDWDKQDSEEGSDFDLEFDLLDDLAPEPAHKVNATK